MLYAAQQALADAGLPARLLAGLYPSYLQINPFARGIAAACEFLAHSAPSHERPDFRITKSVVRGKAVSIKEETVWKKHPFCKLIHFRKEEGRAQPRVLLVAPLSGHFATLLRGTIEAFLPHHDVYITDWANARDVPLWQGSFSLDDSIDVIMDCMRFLGPETHVVAVCQPAVTVLVAAAILAVTSSGCEPASMTLIGGPIDTRINPTEVNRFAAGHSLGWFKERLISHVPLPHLGAFRPVYPGFLQLAGFLAMNFDRHRAAHQKMFQDLVRGDGESAASTRAFYQEYTTVMDLTAEFFLDTVKRVFKEHHLPEGRFTYRGETVDPRAIERTACLVIEGELDDICGVGQTSAALPLLSGLRSAKKAYHLQEGVGHYGMFNGSRFRNEVYPVMRTFIAKNS